MTKISLIASCLSLVLCLFGEQALAQDAAGADASEDTSAEQRPWNVGVSVEDRETAQALYEQGNRHFERSGYSKALREYRKAILLWDHPAIRYNMAICLMHLDQPIEAATHLTESLRHGEKPIGHRLFSEGKLHQKNLAARLAVVHISTTEAGAKVSLDGEEIFTGPGSVQRTVLSRKHQIVGSKDNMLTLTKDFMPEAGRELRIELAFISLGNGLVLERRWAQWKPWAVVAGGVLASAVGGGFYALAKRNMKAFDDGIALSCPVGCFSDSPTYLALEDKADTAELQNIVMVAGLSLGGVALTTGLILVVLNREQARQVKASEKIQLNQSSQAGLSISPPLGGNSRTWLAKYGFDF